MNNMYFTRIKNLLKKYRNSKTVSNEYKANIKKIA